MTRVLIVSDIRLYRDGLMRFLAHDARIEVVGATGCWREAERTLDDRRPEVALIDLAMPDVAPAIRRLLHELPETKVVALGLTGEESEVLDWAEVGISGYVCRDATLEDLIEAVQAATRNELSCSNRLAAALLQRVGRLASRLELSGDHGQLTAREQEILRLLERGLTNKQISSRLTIEVTTVKNHVHNILEKLGAQNRGEAVARARKLGLASLGRKAAESSPPRPRPSP